MVVLAPVSARCVCARQGRISNRPAAECQYLSREISYQEILNVHVYPCKEKVHMYIHTCSESSGS